MIGGLIVAASLMAPKPIAFYVSPKGNDMYSGRLASVNKAKNDGPLASLDRALKLAKSLRKNGNSTPILIELASGNYYQSDKSDLSDMSELTIRGKNAHLIGGVLIKKWSAQADGTWTALQPSAFCPVSLFDPNGRIKRSRVPETGWFNIADTMEASPEFKGKGWDRFKFKSGDLDPTWQNLNDIEVTTIHIWGMSRLRIKSIDAESQVLTFTGSTAYETNWAAFEKGGRYALENVREALKPGQFYIDKEKKLVHYMPKPREDPTKLAIVYPTTDRLLVLKNCLNINVEGVSFENTGYETPATGRNFPQAEADLPSVIEATGCDGLIIKDCAVRNCDVYGIDLGIGTRNSMVENCEITDLGAGGIKIGGLAFEADESKVAGHNTVRNCLLQKLGRVHPAAIGVFIGQSPYNTVEHNDIDDLFYTGISLGWSWGYATSNTHHNRIAFNHIRNIGQGVLSDMGGVYHLGVAPGTVIENNLIHDIKSFSYGGWGLYTDEGSSNVVLQNNVVYRTKSAGFHQHYGKENIVRNNIFAFGGEAQVMRSREEEHQSFRFENNIVYWSDAPLLGSNWSNNHFLMNKNIYWRTDGKPVDFKGLSLADWQKKGHDLNSLIADPMFLNPLKDDFSLKPNSPAIKLGFKPIDLSKVGRIKGKG